MSYWLGCTVALVGVLCRYTVRDLGFVDLEGPEYQLVQVGPGLGEPERSLPAANLRLAWRDSDLAPQDPVVLALRSQGAVEGWALWREGLDPLPLPVSVHADPAGSGVGDGWDAAVQAALEAPWQDQLSREALASFATAIVIESGDAEADEALAQLLDRTLLDFKAMEGQLPREVPWPLRRLAIAEGERAAARVLLWSLGLDGQEARQRLERGPALALVYGRGKLAGPVLSGPLLERDELLAQLVIVAESCECETPRDWVLEPRLPLPWPDGRRAACLSELGFDPESPLVQAEVRRILAKTASQKSGGADSVSSLLFGYREQGLDRGTEAGEARSGLGTSQVDDPPGWVEGDSGDWGFAEPVEEGGDPDGEIARDPKRNAEALNPAAEPAEEPEIETRAWLVLALFGGAGIAGAWLLWRWLRA